MARHGLRIGHTRQDPAGSGEAIQGGEVEQGLKLRHGGVEGLGGVDAVNGGPLYFRVLVTVNSAVRPPLLRCSCDCVNP